ncbi:uncharacterized protein LOC119293181 [Triticum dicoccoides]|uniref:uncharacterized protein LOC119293181 n=1 Tax=Triticum dicoccoides TaxID=85692 RepID=UPI0018903332|nr:uncharacterized protein LOC119293181 [Triticum dicoccoides]
MVQVVYLLLFLWYSPPEGKVRLVICLVLIAGFSFVAAAGFFSLLKDPRLPLGILGDVRWSHSSAYFCVANQRCWEHVYLGCRVFAFEWDMFDSQWFPSPATRCFSNSIELCWHRVWDMPGGPLGQGQVLRMKGEGVRQLLSSRSSWQVGNSVGMKGEGVAPLLLEPQVGNC